MTDPYETCPVLESEHYLLRLLEATDAPDLLLVYSDEKAVPFFNGDNCHGDDFHYTTLERMQSAIQFWLTAYATRDFARLSIVDKGTQHAIGTIELFNRRAKDYFDNCGLLRLDLRSDHEREESILEILTLLAAPAFELFDCGMIATKIPKYALERQKAAQRAGFAASPQHLIGGDDGKVYTDYYVLLKPLQQ